LASFVGFSLVRFNLLEKRREREGREKGERRRERRIERREREGREKGE
jgi:hypothetical protein